MMLEQHYDEEVLIGLLDEPKPDAHLDSCETCRAALHSIRSVTSALHEDAVWDRRELDEAPKAATREKLRAFASSIAAEDAAAEPWVKSLLARPADEWQGIVDAHPEWRTAGFVRKLVAAVDAINFTAPTDAVELTKIASEIAESLQEFGNRVLKVKAAAWREYAFALHAVGSYRAALDATSRCDSHLANCRFSEIEQGNAALVRSSIYAALERLDEALALTRTAQTLFFKFGATGRVVVARLYEAAMLQRMRRYAAARDAYLRVGNDRNADQFSRACAVQNAGMCCRELGRFDEARTLLGRSVTAFEDLRMPVLREKARWNLAGLLAAEGSHAEALELLSSVRQEFKELGLSHELALVSVDEAETLLVAGRLEEVGTLCRNAIAYFKEENLTYTQGALTALAFLSELADKQELTVSVVREVRAFIEILPKRPELIFARVD